MIRFLTGNLFDSNAEAFVNTVNTQGVMGKGIALQFKERFPQNARAYIKACKEGAVAVGKLFITKEKGLYQNEKTIINFPTKTTWRKPSEYSYIEEGLKELVETIKERQILSIAIPPLGAGNGGLNWVRVKQLIVQYLTPLNAKIYVYEPGPAIQEVLRLERVKLTPARAMLLDVMYDLTKNGEFVSEFSAEKIAYFLQKFGASEVFKLDFRQNFYGPYSGKVKHILYQLNGSYITGYNSKDKRPFEELSLVTGGEQDVDAFLGEKNNQKYKDIAGKTRQFLSGFYSAFGLELLSTVDFIMAEKKDSTSQEIYQRIQQWSDRKKTLFHSIKFVEIAADHLRTYQNFAADGVIDASQ